MRLVPSLRFSVTSTFPAYSAKPKEEEIKMTEGKITEYVCDGTFNPDCDEPELTDLVA